MRRKIFMIISLLATFLVMNSCLKDNVGLYWTDDLKGKAYAEVWNGGLSTLAVKPVPDPVIFKFLVNIASDQPPTEDITVTLAIDTSAMGRYNRIKKLTGAKAFKLYPYAQLLNTSVTIPAGSRNAYAHVKIWNMNLNNACDLLMVPVVLSSATGGVIPADPVGQGGCLKSISISNPYEGTYHVTGTFSHPTAGDRAIDRDKVATTYDCRTIQSEPGDVGGTGLLLTVNNDNTVTIGGQYSSTQGLFAITGKPNVYDPATKTFTLNYYYPGSGGNRNMTEVWVKK